MNVTKKELFVTPVWEIDTKLDKKFNENLLKEINTFYQTQPKFDFLDLWQANTPYINRMKKYILDVVRDETISEVSSVYQNKDDIIYFHSRGWANYIPPGDSLSIHGHGTAKLAVTYYIDVPENSGDLLLIDPRGSVDWDLGRDGCTNSKFSRIKPKESMLVFFPGYVLHTIERNASTGVRISLTTNVHTISKAEVESIRRNFE